MAERDPSPDEEESPSDPDEPPDVDKPTEDQPAEPEPEPPFETETIRYSAEGGLLRVTLDGPKVSGQSIDVYTLGGFLAQVDRVVRGLTAAAEGLSLSPTGRIPRPPNAAPWRARALVFAHSATLDFELGEPEVTSMSIAGEVTSPTMEAVATLGRLVGLEPEEAVGNVRDFDDRIGNDFSDLVALLADNSLSSRWDPVRVEPVTLPPDRAEQVRTALRSEVGPTTGVVTISGFLFRLDAKVNTFRLQPEEGPAVTGSYDEALIPQLRNAWSHRVVAELGRTEYRYAYATRPHLVDHALDRIVTILGPVEGEEETSSP